MPHFRKKMLMPNPVIHRRHHHRCHPKLNHPFRIRTTIIIITIFLPADVHTPKERVEQVPQHDQRMMTRKAAVTTTIPLFLPCLRFQRGRFYRNHKMTTYIGRFTLTTTLHINNQKHRWSCSSISNNNNKLHLRIRLRMKKTASPTRELHTL